MFWFFYRAIKLYLRCPSMCIFFIRINNSSLYLCRSGWVQVWTKRYIRNGDEGLRSTGLLSGCVSPLPVIIWVCAYLSLLPFRSKCNNEYVFSYFLWSVSDNTYKNWQSSSHSDFLSFFARCCIERCQYEPVYMVKSSCIENSFPSYNTTI